MAEVSLFIVRVWQQATGFRAALRRVDDEQPQCFDTPEQVTEFLVRAGAPGAPPQAPGDDDAAAPTP
jgi:hypothetical protein